VTRFQLAACEPAFSGRRARLHRRIPPYIADGRKRRKGTVMRMKRIILALAGIALAALGSIGNASATVLFQSIPDLTVHPTVGTFCSSCPGFGPSIPAANQMIGEKFSLAGGASIGSIDVVVSTVSFWPTPVTVTIYADAGSNTLGQMLFGQTFSAFGSQTDTAFSTDVAGINTSGLKLAAGTYDLFISNFSGLLVPGYGGGTGDQIILSDVTAPPPSGHAYTFGTTPLDTGLLIEGNVVPEPSSVALLGVGLACLLIRRRRRTTSSVADCGGLAQPCS
jgi:hypothetical protein